MKISLDVSPKMILKWAAWLPYVMNILGFHDDIFLRNINDDIIQPK